MDLQMERTAQCSVTTYKPYWRLPVPNRKTCKKNRTILSVPDRDGRFTGSPGAETLPTAPGGSWGWRGGETLRDGLKGEQKFTATSGLRVRVCVCSVSWSPPYIYITRVCCSAPACVCAVLGSSVCV